MSSARRTGSFVTNVFIIPFSFMDSKIIVPVQERESAGFLFFPRNEKLPESCMRIPSQVRPSGHTQDSIPVTIPGIGE